MKFVPVKGTDVLFCIWKTRVKDFEAFVAATKHNATAGMYSLRGEVGRHRDTWQSPGFTQGPLHPVCGVCWDDAKAFCAWLTKKEAAEGTLQPGQHYRLPTDREWSAAVGLEKELGTLPAHRDGLVKDFYPWGKQWPAPRGAGNFAGLEFQADAAGKPTVPGYEDGFVRTSPVGSFAPNAAGLFDLGSNLREWCEDYFCTADELSRVQRGAAWNDGTQLALLASFRRHANPGRRADTFGFRCVLVSSPPPRLQSGHVDF